MTLEINEIGIQTRVRPPSPGQGAGSVGAQSLSIRPAAAASPHLVTVPEGEALPNLGGPIYGRSAFYQQAHTMTALNQSRCIPAGPELSFPPLRPSST
jgi:hypothetical protein